MRKSQLAILVIAATACTEAPVDWNEMVYSGAPNQPQELPGPTQSVPDIPAACPGSMRTARAGSTEYAVWWQANTDSSATLFVSRNNTGKWSEPVVADSTDKGVRGCGRTAPAIAADSASGYVHLAYFAEPASGPGVFFEHTMDSAKTFHSPVAIVFGRNPSRVSVAAKGDIVAVAFEDPNASQPIVSLALSKTMGHIFEHRLQASGENGNARQPVVRITGDSVALWWSEYSTDPSVSATRTVYRAGKLK